MTARGGFFDVDQVGLKHLATVEQGRLAKSATVLAIAQRVDLDRDPVARLERLTAPAQPRQIARTGQFDRPYAALTRRPGNIDKQRNMRVDPAKFFTLPCKVTTLAGSNMAKL
jgi:hypothetical protein